MNARASYSAHPFPETTWQAATARIEDYLRAHRVTDEGRVTRIAADIIALARAQHRAGLEPLAMAFEVLEGGMDQWMRAALRPNPSGETGPSRIAAVSERTRGRVALALADVPTRWPEHFLQRRSVPVELMRALGEAGLKRGPELRLSHMAPARVEAAAAWPRVRASLRWPFFRVITGLAAMLSLLGLAVTARR